MRTNIVIDDELLQEAMKLSGARTRKELIAAALEEYVRSRRRKNLLELEGGIEFRDGYDYKSLRQGS